MSLRKSGVVFLVPVAAALWILSLVPAGTSAYELQDTIHTLKEENLHLQHRLENLTHALRDLKHLLLDHSRASEHDGEAQHAWTEWTQHGISPETHRVLEQAFCGPDLHGAARTLLALPLLLLLPVSSLVCWSTTPP